MTVRAVVHQLAAAEAVIHGRRLDRREYAQGVEHALMSAHAPHGTPGATARDAPSPAHRPPARSGSWVAGGRERSPRPPGQTVDRSGLSGAPRPWIVALERLNRWEAELVERRAALSPARPPAALTRISALARGGRLWFAIAALMATRSPATRRAARDGVAALLLGQQLRAGAQPRRVPTSAHRWPPPRPRRTGAPAQDALVPVVTQCRRRRLHHRRRTPQPDHRDDARPPGSQHRLRPVSAPEPTGRPTSLPGSPSEP